MATGIIIRQKRRQNRAPDNPHHAIGLAFALEPTFPEVVHTVLNGAERDAEAGGNEGSVFIPAIEHPEAAVIEPLGAAGEAVDSVSGHVYTVSRDIVFTLSPPPPAPPDLASAQCT